MARRKTTRTRTTRVRRTKRAAARTSAPPELKTVTLKASGGPPAIDIAFGYAQHGLYKIAIWDAQGASPRVIGEGVNTDNVPDQFPLGEPLAELDKRIVSWEGLITSFTGNPGERYSVTMRFIQNGADTPDSPFTQSGSLNNTKAFYDAVRLVVVP